MTTVEFWYSRSELINNEFVISKVKTHKTEQSVWSESSKSILTTKPVHIDIGVQDLALTPPQELAVLPDQAAPMSYYYWQAESTSPSTADMQFQWGFTLSLPEWIVPLAGAFIELDIRVEVLDIDSMVNDNRWLDFIRGAVVNTLMDQVTGFYIRDSMGYMARHSSNNYVWITRCLGVLAKKLLSPPVLKYSFQCNTDYTKADYKTHSCALAASVDLRARHLFDRTVESPLTLTEEERSRSSSTSETSDDFTQVSNCFE